MKNIIGIFKRDVKSIVKNPVALIIMVGLLIIPSLYAWFNIIANWNPYGNTSKLPIAVASVDKGTTIEGNSINAGQMVVDALKENHDMGWTFVSKDEAIEGVKSGEYYAAAVIPEDFSQNISSILTGTIKKPSIDYYLNEKKNAIANKMTDVGLETVQTKVNQTFVATITQVVGKFLNLSADKLSNQDPIDSLVQSLNALNKNLSDFSTTVSAFKNTTASVSELLHAVTLTLPDVNAVINDSKAIGGDIQNVINSSRAVSLRLNTTLEEIIDAVKTTITQTDTQLSALKNLIGQSSSELTASLYTIKDSCNQTIDVCNKLISIFKNLETQLPDLKPVIDPVIAALEQAVQTEQSMITTIDQLILKVQSTGELSIDEINTLINTNREIASLLDQTLMLYRTGLSPAFDAAINNVYDGIGNLSTLLTTTGAGLPRINEAITSIDNALNSNSKALDDILTIMNQGKDKVDQMIKSLTSVKNDERWGVFMNLMRLNPEASSSFISAPVNLKTIAMYPVANYGAAMTPFYTTLCIWVGGLVLAAILKTDVKNPKEFKNLKPHEEYLGRGLIFVLGGMLQGLIVSLGNIFILDVQMVEPLLFVIISVIAGFVFSLFIYTLTVAFDEVGKAIAVILLVIQVAGAGGTYPIQVLPEFFQVTYPLMAFNYGINAMREAVCGVYANAFWIDTLKMCAYIPVALFIGLSLRKPLIKLNQFFKNKLHDTGLM